MMRGRWCGPAAVTLPCARPSTPTSLAVLRSVLMPSSRSIATSRREQSRSKSGRTSEWKSRIVAANTSWSYYQENPQWYVANRPGFPSKQKILEARDHVLGDNPKLRMVGVHLGSMERDLDNIARHFDKYPNFAIDTAARMDYLMLMPPEKVAAFLVKYQDRVLYGTDLDLHADAELSDALTEWQSTYARDWKFLATGETLTVNGKQVHGLNLPRPVLQKIFHDNAIRWIPGL